MSGSYCTVYARCELTEDCLSRIDDFLARSADAIWRTRKGRCWGIEVSRRGFGVTAWENRYDDPMLDEGELLGLGLLPEDTPFRLDLGAVLKDCETRELLRKISLGLAILLDGIVTEVRT